MNPEHKKELDNIMIELVKILTAYVLSLKLYNVTDRSLDSEIEKTENIYEERIRQLNLKMENILKT